MVNYKKKHMEKVNEMKKKYETDLTNAQWEAIAPRFKEINGNYGKNGVISKRKLINAVFYKLKTGCQWRMLPNDLPDWSAVWSFYRRAKESGLWEWILADLVAESRKQAGRSPEPSYSLIDSQSVKTVSSSEEMGFDGGKKNKGA
jgi:putative transposase